MRPLIGVIPAVDDEKTTSVFRVYINAVEKAGGTPILLPYCESGEAIDHFVSICDGFLFVGGVDMDPARYGQGMSPACGPVVTCCDDFHFAVFHRVLSTEKPLFAICRGMQIMNVVLGGTLYQDLPTERPTTIKHQQEEPKFDHSHAVELVEGMPLRTLLGRERITVNSFHHQAVKTLGKGLKVMARADDGTVEAVYIPGTRYVRGLQWHPERLYEKDGYAKKIFDEFIAASSK